MRAEWHLLVSFSLAILFVLLAGYWHLINLKSSEPLYLAGLVILSGVFIDLDHILDFWISKPQALFSVRAFLNPYFYIYQVNHKAYIIWHSWEVVAALFVVVWLSGWPLWLLALWLAILNHLLFDQAFNRSLKPGAYFWAYRFAKHFRVLQ